MVNSTDTMLSFSLWFCEMSKCHLNPSKYVPWFSPLGTRYIKIISSVPLLWESQSLADKGIGRTITVTGESRKFYDGSTTFLCSRFKE